MEVLAFEPYRNYTYDYQGETWGEPQAYIPGGVIRGEDLGIGAFLSPSDIFVASDRRIFIADTGNNRIVILTSSFALERTIDSFNNENIIETFNKPEGVFVTEEGTIYIADTENRRIVILGSDYALDRIIPEPDFKVDMPLIYRPIRIVVDQAGRMFIISRHFNMGMIELDATGQFDSFFGAITVSANLVNRLWRRIATQEQRDRMVQSVPTEYSGNAVDPEGFVYGTIGTPNAPQPIRKLNPMGVDVLRRLSLNPPQGDLSISYDDKGWPVRSSLTDICLGDYGVYSVLDATRGRIFTYSEDGSLMYVFGSLGNRVGSFLQPNAIDRTADGEYLVADGILQQVVRFRPTSYASLIHEAIRAQYRREYAEAERQWMEVLRYTSKSEMAYIEIGKAYYRKGAYASAMRYFRLGNDRIQYSKAFKKFRRESMGAVFDVGMSALVLVLVGVLYLVIRRRLDRRGGKTDGND